MSASLRGAVRPQDLLLAILFIAMAAIAPERDPSEIILILFLGALQITESRVIALDTVRGKVIWNVVKLAAGYLLIGYTGGVQSPYYLVLLFPVITAAATLGVVSTLAFTALACGTYLSFLFYVDWKTSYIEADQAAILILRVLILGIAGMLVNTLALALREQNLRLGEANRSLRAAEAQLRRGERLAALGQLTAGLAHELRNPLGTIKASADMLERNLPPDRDVAKELAGYISSEVDRTNSLVSRFLDFARPLELKRATADLRRVVKSAIAAAALDAEKHDVRVKDGASDEPVVFPLDAELMERVFFNLVQNAIQASRAGTEVRVETSKNGAEAAVRIIDHGIGIEPDKMETIFNPFVTSKPNGTGLGLAIVAKVVDEHGGKISVQSSPGQGTVFTVTLPMRAAE